MKQNPIVESLYERGKTSKRSLNESNNDYETSNRTYTKSDKNRVLADKTRWTKTVDLDTGKVTGDTKSKYDWIYDAVKKRYPNKSDAEIMEIVKKRPNVTLDMKNKKVSWGDEMDESFDENARGKEDYDPNQRFYTDEDKRAVRDDKYITTQTNKGKAFAVDKNGRRKKGKFTRTDKGDAFLVDKHGRRMTEDFVTDYIDQDYRVVQISTDILIPPDANGDIVAEEVCSLINNSTDYTCLGSICSEDMTTAYIELGIDV